LESVAALRSLAKQDNLQREFLDLNAVIWDALALVPDRENITSGDRVQLQQPVFNRVNTVIDAMESTTFI